MRSIPRTAFDPLWKDLGLRRGKAYAKLADALGIPVDDCHIGMFDEAMCAKVVAACGLLRQEALAAGPAQVEFGRANKT